ncbi:MAG: toprim domain-containing protein, partial [Succinivibrio sp.]
LFGLYETLKNNNNRPPRIVVVEGYMDVISVRQAGCSYAVASLGTATTQEQITEMFRHTDKVVFCYDGDSAGRHAAWHALETVTPIMQEDKEIRFAFLPVEHDPDSLVRECGLKAFEEYLDKALSYPEFLILHKAESFNLKDPNELSVFVNETVKLATKIPVASMRNVVLKLLAAPSGFSESQLYDMLKDCMEKEITGGKENPLGEVSDNSGDEQQNLLKTPMRRLMAFIIQQPTVVATVYQDFDVDEFLSLCRRQDIRGLDFLEYILGLIEDNRSIMPSDIIELTRDTPNERIVRQLINAPLKTTIDKGVELTFVQKIDYFAELMSDVLTEPLKQRAQYLKMRISQGDRSALEEYTMMQTKILAREHNS